MALDERRSLPDPDIDEFPTQEDPPTNPRLTSSFNPEYLNRSSIGKAYHVAKKQKFGKDNLEQTYTCEASFAHSILALFKSDLLTRDDLTSLFSAYPRAGTLWKEWNRVKDLDFTVLMEPNPDYVEVGDR